VGEWEFYLDHAVDGDTVVDRCGRHLRVVGMDTPELSEPFGEEALRETERFFKEKGERFRGRVCREEPYDRYGRLLVRIFSPSGEDLTQRLLSRGLAYPLPIPPCSLPYEREDYTLFARARSAQLGIFSRIETTEIPGEEAGFSCSQYRTVVGKVRAVKEKRREGLVVELKRLRLRFPAEALLHHPGLKEKVYRLPGKIVRAEGKIHCGKRGAQITLWSPLLFSSGTPGNTPDR
jgi:endonuclease YncB( thermonuclease family)